MVMENLVFFLLLAFTLVNRHPYWTALSPNQNGGIKGSKLTFDSIWILLFEKGLKGAPWDTHKYQCVMKS